MLNVICKAADKGKMVTLFFRHTTTLGLRESITNRYTLRRKIENS